MLRSLLLKKHLESDEELLRVVHKHWLIGLRTLVWPTLFIAILVVIALYMPVTRPLMIALSVIGLIAFIWWLRNFLDYYLDAWLITNEGVIDIAWHGWFHRESTRVLYSDIQGISYEIKGVMSTLFRYGTISVEKISTGTSIELSHVYRPKRIEILALRNMETYLHKKNLKDSAQIKDLLASMVAEHINKKSMEGFVPDDEE